MRVVITGGPSVGKTTIINLLEALGYPVVHEQATKLIKEGHLMPWVDRVNFQKEVLRRQLEAEDAVPELDQPVFLDRGLYDGEAYYIYDKLEVPRIFDSLDASRYGLALLIEELPVFEKTEIRMSRENLEFSRQIAILLENCYRSRHIPVARIPAMPPDERTEYVLEKVKQFMGQESKLSNSGKHSIVELQKQMAAAK